MFQDGNAKKGETMQHKNINSKDFLTYEDATAANIKDFWAYDNEWSKKICNLPAFQSQNYVLYTDVPILDMISSNPANSLESIPDFIKNGARMNFLICNKEHAVLGIKFYDENEYDEKSFHSSICSEYLKDLPVLQLSWTQYTKYGLANSITPTFFDKLDFRLARYTKSPPTQNIIYKTFPLCMSAGDINNYLKFHFLVQVNYDVPASDICYIPSDYGKSIGIVQSHDSANDFSLRCSQRTINELKRHVEFQSGNIQLLKDYSAYPNTYDRDLNVLLNL